MVYTIKGGAMKVIRILFLAALAVSLAAAPLYAEDEGFGQAHVYKYPEIEPEFSIWGGYTLTDVNGSKRAGEYINFEDSPTVGGKVTAFPFPHRFHWELDVMNDEDYFSDIRYSYKDLVLVRSVNRALFHNLSDIDLVQPAGFAPINDPTGGDYGYGAAYGNISVRLKAPHYPAHAFLNVWYMSKDGDRQQRRIGGSAHFGNRPRVTERRSMDWTTTDVTFGINSHLGPVEAQYSHSELRFKARDGVDSASYTAGGGRAAGIYPHSVVPGLETSTDTFKIHTSYTGRLVASATFIVGDDRNNTSLANADHYLTSGELVWTPIAKFTGALRLKHEERRVDNPDSLPLNYLGFGSFNAAYIGTINTNLKDTISTDINTLTAIARYRPTNKITIGANATFRRWDRENALAWKVVEQTSETILRTSVNVRAFKNLKFKVRYHYRDFDNPAHATQPDDSHRFDLSATWTPLVRLIVFTSFDVTREDRDSFELHGRIDAGNPDGIVEARNRDVSRDTFTASATYLVRDNLSFTGSFGYWDNKTAQEVTYVVGLPLRQTPRRGKSIRLSHGTLRSR
jgi:hypothetical protein